MDLSDWAKSELLRMLENDAIEDSRIIAEVLDSGCLTVASERLFLYAFSSGRYHELLRLASAAGISHRMMGEWADVAETFSAHGIEVNDDNLLSMLPFRLPITFFSVWCSAVRRCAVPRRVGARLRAEQARAGRMAAPAPAAAAALAHA